MREVIKCPNCSMNQYVTISGDCRKCKRPLVAIPETSPELKAKQDAMKARWSFVHGEHVRAAPDDGFTTSFGLRITRPSKIRVQFESGTRRLTQTMCEQCIKGKHSLCASRSCPCVCNDSDFGLHPIQTVQALAAHG